MKKRKDIGVDVDGVIRNFPLSLIKRYKKYYPEHDVVPLRNWSHYELHPYFPIGKGIHNFYCEEHPEEIYLNAIRYSGALKFVKELSKDFNVVIVTNQPNEYLDHLTKEWLKLSLMPYDYFFPTPDKTKFKGEYILEDASHHLEAILAKGNAVPVCFSHPWNQDWTGLRVKNYQGFLDLIRNNH
ncbi:MAG: hypothetical protein AABW56_04575 [Nanoarchaeota archaeon]